MAVTARPGVSSYIQSSAYPNRNFWMTECGAWCAPCDSGVLGTYDWTFCKGTATNLMEHLLNNASAALVWEVYDSQYNYYSPLEWSFWGLFGVDDTNAVVRTYHAAQDFLYAGADQPVCSTGSPAHWGDWLDGALYSAAGVQAHGPGPNHHIGRQHVEQRVHTERHAGITASGAVPGIFTTRRPIPTWPMLERSPSPVTSSPRPSPPIAYSPWPALAESPQLSPIRVLCPAQW